MNSINLNTATPANPNCFKATYFDDEVWFVLDDSYLADTPSQAITYTLAEAQHLARQSPWTRRMVHEAKKHGAQLPLPQHHPHTTPTTPTQQGHSPSQPSHPA